MQLFYIAVVSIAIISVALAVLSLEKEMKKPRHGEVVKKDLEKGRVIFYSDSSSEESSA